ncbi:MAG TPA: patatin-like phospholipase family protein, partial [Chthoniobacterales bacterium]
MTKGASQENASLGLADVLEKEFIQLHGDFPGHDNSSGDAESRLRAIWSAIHALPEEQERAALCISGGGIRSATFGLGVLQGLARCGLLDKFHYLSTVSGGGYIGSWFSAWIRNHGGGAPDVIAALRRRTDSGLNPEPQPIHHLREFSNYLAPRSGLTSVDFWTLIATFIRNIFLNWLVLISWLAAAMMIPRLYLVVINLQPDWAGRAMAYQFQLLADKMPANWAAWEDSVKHSWNMGLTILLAVGLVLLAGAMAYAIVDVPSTGNARLPQRR